MEVVVVNDSGRVGPGKEKRTTGNVDDADDAESSASSGGLFSIFWWFVPLLGLSFSPSSS